MKNLLVLTIIFIGLFSAFNVRAGIIVRPVFNAGLVGYWSFQEGAGNNVYDKSGKGNTGTWYGTGSHWADGKIGKGGSFNGSDDYVDLGTSSDLPERAPLTLTAWINGNNISGTVRVIARWDATGTKFAFQMTVDSNVVSCTARNVDTDDVYYVNVNQVVETNNDKWVFVACVMGDLEMYGYRYGVANSRRAAGSDIGWDASGTGAKTTIGANWTAGAASSYFPGIIDEVRVYNRVLSESEIQRIYKLSQPKINASQNNRLTNGLVGLWSFNGSDILQNGGSPQFVQSGSTYSTNSITLTGVSAGNLLVAFVSTNNNSLANTSISDNKGNTWNALTNRLTSGGNYMRVYYAMNAAAGDTTISVTNPVGDFGWSVHEYSGIAMSNALDVEGFYSNEGDTETFTSGQITTTNAHDLLVSIVANESNSSAITWTGSFNERTEETDHEHSTADRVVTSTGNYEATGTYSNGNTWYACIIVAFKAANLATDRSGQGNNGTIYGAVPAIGKVGQALSFNGTTDYVSTNYQMTDNQSFSYSVWFNARTLSSGDHEICGNENIQAPPAARGASIRYWYDGGSTYLLLAYIADSSGEDQGPYYDLGASLNTWHHVVLVYDYAASMAKLYVDGVFHNTGTDSDTVNGFDTHDVPDSWNIGRQFYGFSYFDGKIDEVRVYNRALKTSEITALYNSGLAKINASQNNQITNGLVGLWSFNGSDIDGNEAYDRSGNGNKGTITGNTTRTIGKVGQALDFDGSGDYVDIADSDITDITGAISVSAWIKARAISSGSGNREILLKYQDSSAMYSQYRLKLNNKNVVFTISDGSSFGTVTTSNDPIAIGNWYHVVGVWDGTTNSGGMKIYINGALNTSAQSTISSIWDPGDGVNYRMFIGGDWLGGQQEYFDGVIDEVRLYSRALTAQEVLRLYNLGR